MKPPIYQKLITWLSYGILGFAGLGSFIGAINDANVLITPIMSCGTTVSALILFVIVEIILRRKKLPWHTESGEFVNVTSLGVKARIALLGALTLLWIPRLPELATMVTNAFQDEQNSLVFYIYITNKRYKTIYLNKFGEFYIFEPTTITSNTTLAKGRLKLNSDSYEFEQKNPFSTLLDNIQPISIPPSYVFGEVSTYYRGKVALIYPDSKMSELHYYLSSSELTMRIKFTLLDGTTVSQDKSFISESDFLSPDWNLYVLAIQ